MVEAHMHRFLVLAVAEIDARQRISRTIEAWSELHALRIANRELQACAIGYYVVDVRELT